MKINLKLKERREKINKVKQHQKIKAVRQYKKQIKEMEENFDEEIHKKINLFLQNEKKENSYNNNFLKEEEDLKNKKTTQRKNKINWKNELKNEKLLNKKRIQEKKHLQKKLKLDIRKKNYRNMKKTNKYGQPIMKFQLKNIFDKIKKKKAAGLI